MANRTTMSAGLLLYRRTGDTLEVLLAHPGGPFWARRDAGAWSIPKGLVAAGEEPLAAAVLRVCRAFLLTWIFHWPLSRVFEAMLEFAL